MTGNTYRLPTEQEWEYAARAGSADSLEPPALFTDKKLAWASSYALTSRGSKITKPAGSHGANEFGIFDVEGNVWEWTQTCWKTGAIPENRKLSNCGLRVIQGEHRTYMPNFLREIGTGGCAVRPLPGNFGFRLVLES